MISVHLLLQISKVSSEHKHWPLLQTDAAGHLPPHFPQWALLKRTSTHFPVQESSPSLGQRQVPSTQLVPAGQMVPQVPQFLISAIGSIHLFLQTI